MTHTACLIFLVLLHRGIVPVASSSTIQNRVTARKHQDSDTTPSLKTLNALDKNMPMHKRFLMDIKDVKDSSLIHIESKRREEMKSENHNFGETTERALSILSSPWWVRLYEGEHKPETRRAHSATVLTIDESKNDTPTTNSSVVSDVSDESNVRYTLSNTKRTMNRRLKNDQEYMIITGGFTDRDWKTFPVWAYDMTSAIENDEGRWYDLTPPRSSDDSSCRDANLTNNSSHNEWSNSLPCSPQSRVVHISVVRDNYLYVFGGLMYDEVNGIFLMEDMPYMYRMYLSEHEFEGRDYENYDKNFKADGISTTMQWERILPNIIHPPREFIGDEEPSRALFLQMVNRGEVRGGYWEAEDKLVIYGGLHVREYDANFRRKQQADQALGDVWAYDFNSDSWEMLSPSRGNGNSPHPGARTSHGGVVVGDELLINGGLREEEMFVWNGETIWQQLEDVWVFNLKTRVWKERVMITPVGRSYQSAVGFVTNDKIGSVLVMFGGFKSVMDPVDNQQVSYVYDDTLVSFPPSEEWTQKSVWFAATYEGLETNMISTRLEHSAVLSKSGIMIVWGGRYRGTSEINGLWSINISGSESTVKFDIHIEDENVSDIGYAYVVLLTIMMTSMMVTYTCGAIQRRMEAAGNNEDDAQHHGQATGGSMFGRTGLNQDIIDTLPLKIYSEKELSKLESHNVATRSLNGNDDSNNSSESCPNDCDDNCCPICLGEYNIGDEVRCLPCHHEFHKDCVDNWLATHASCPACRHSLQDLVNLTATVETVSAQIRAATARLMRRNTHDSHSQIELSTLPSQTNSQESVSVRSAIAYQPNDADSNTFDRANALERLRRMIRIRRMNRSLHIPTTDFVNSPSDSFDIANGEIGYASSLELAEELDMNRSASIDDGELPLAGHSGRMMVNSRRQERRSRREGVLSLPIRQRRNRLPGSPLNAPLQLDNTIV